jgi:hypothetical protein
MTEAERERENNTERHSERDRVRGTDREVQSTREEEKESAMCVRVCENKRDCKTLSE